MEERENNTYMRAICRGAAIAICFIALYAIVSVIMIFFAVALENQLYSGIKPFMFGIAASAISPVIFNSFALAFSYSDKVQIEEFMMREDKEVTFAGELMSTLKSPKLMAEIITECLIIVAASFIGIFFSFKYAFPDAVMPGAWFPAVILTPLCFIFAILSKYEASRKFSHMDKKNRLEEYRPTLWFIKRIIILFVVYPLASPMIPFVGITVFSFGAVFTQLSAIFSLLGTILGIALIIFAVWCIIVLRRMSERKKFLKRLKKIADAEGYTMSKPENPYRSFATSRDQCAFSLERDGRKFDCLVISILRRGVPIVFTSPNDAFFLHKIGTKNHFVSLKHNIEFLHIGEGEKIIVLEPSPKYIFAEDGIQRVRLGGSDKIWNIDLYDTEAFLGCVERKCLGENGKR